MPALLSPSVGTELFESKGMLMAVITCSGILVVFVILLLLIFIFYAYGGIIRAFTASKEKKAAAKKAAEASAKAQEAAASPTPAAQSPQTQDGEIPGEIIAVIAAAVAAMSNGKKLAVKKISRSQRQTGGRSAWAASGIYENTRPF